MTLNDLILLSNAGHLRRNLGDNWEYERNENVFTIAYKDNLGGIKVKVNREEGKEEYGNAVDVYRIINGCEQEILNSYEEIAKRTQLENIHWGVSQRMKYIFGF
ncbi:hypothetical protein [Bacillus paranthracis]|uniref:hypothetical protein n=1 Tax=Bacillus paranthracis TaxID=2026186 RepID=UPI002FDC5F0C|nr:hypothetical protein [Bacillus paranthracis]